VKDQLKQKTQDTMTNIQLSSKEKIQALFKAKLVTPGGAKLENLFKKHKLGKLEIIDPNLVDKNMLSSREISQIHS
jgi:hypothetical protein